MANGDLPPRPPLVFVTIIENAHASIIEIPCRDADEATALGKKVWEAVKEIREEYVHHS